MDITIVTHDGNTASPGSNYEISTFHGSGNLSSFDDFDGFGGGNNTTVRAVTGRHLLDLE
ncbi:hypothetical protein [Salinibaculum salinum]|uniref:hypothetical protein n=1 Tax=Salinibaculum salinum TaxID=3131996 RepID=UPI0030ECD42D